MKPAEFEEKEYEAPLYNQLEHGTCLLWSPGQVFEKHIGIDRASLIRNKIVWDILGQKMPPGAFLPGYDWGFIWDKRKKNRKLPDFRLNLFIQAKRPYFYPRIPRGLSLYGIDRPLYKIDINLVQQDSLEKVGKNLGRRAHVCYAAPVFSTISQLNAHTRRRSVVQNSNFPPISSLVGHTSWWYWTSGYQGVGNPKFEYSKGPDLFEHLESLLSEYGQDAKTDAFGNLHSLGDIIEKTIAKEVAVADSRAAEYVLRLNELYSDLNIEDEVVRLLALYQRVRIFAEVYNLEWYVVGN